MRKVKTFHLQGKRIEEKTSNEVSGLIMSGQSLVLQGVQRHQTGNYTCIVSNLEGDAQSNSVLLKILCKFSFPSVDNYKVVSRHKLKL